MCHHLQFTWQIVTQCRYYSSFQQCNFQKVWKIALLINEKVQIRLGRFPPVLFGVNGSKNTIIFMSIVLFIRCQQPILNMYLCIYLYLNCKTANILVFVKKKVRIVCWHLMNKIDFQNELLYLQRDEACPSLELFFSWKVVVKIFKTAKKRRYFKIAKRKRNVFKSRRNFHQTL